MKNKKNKTWRGYVVFVNDYVKFNTFVQNHDTDECNSYSPTGALETAKVFSNLSRAKNYMKKYYKNAPWNFSFVPIEMFYKRRNSRKTNR